jgi:outer membrane protein OmpA-like peptidoglycan-associated protein
LIENGIKADRLNSTGFGETKPIDTTKLLQESKQQKS